MMDEKNVKTRSISMENKQPLYKKLLRWELLIFLLFIGINIININLTSDYLNIANLSNTCKMFLDKGIVVFPMMMVLLLGEIDISVASIIALTGVIMGSVANHGAGTAAVILSGVITGAILGYVNGYLITRFKELSSTIITLATEIFYRGLAWMILENGAFTQWPESMKMFSWGSIGKVPFILAAFILEGLVFAYIIHFTKFGRSLYAVGRNSNASYYSGIRTDRVKRIAFTLNGVFAAAASIFLCSKLGSSRANMAMNYEMDIIAMVILGGVSVSGGVGNVVGVVFSVFVIGLLRYGLGLVNVSSEIIMIIIGALLIVPVALPNLKLFVKESAIITAIRRRKKSTDK